jgi:hypothetical protein
VDLRAEFRSPRHRTYLMYAFQDGDRRFVIRFAPTEAGVWDYRLTSALPRLEGKTGQFTATASDSPGFVHVANVHHFATENNQPQLWVSAALDGFLAMPRGQFDAAVDQRAKEKFTHLRVTIERDADLREAGERIRAINAKGLTADIVLASIPEDRQQRESFLLNVVGRLDAFNVTWMGVPAFEDVAHGRAVLKDAGALIKKFDPYDHPRTTMATATSGALLADGWANMASYGTPDPNIGAVEHQLYQVPGVNTGVRSVRDLWNATMNGQYPSSGSGAYVAAWVDFMSHNRYWELEPYFEVDGGRALALEGVEYIVYVEQPGLVELTVEKHGYDVAWINPATGERIKAKGYSGDHFTGEPPDKSHEWVLHVSREGHKEGMLKSYKFESRSVPVQEVEQDTQKVPFEIAEPAASELSLGQPPRYSIRLKRESRGTRSLLVEWTAEVFTDGEGPRVVGSGREGMMQIPRSIAGTLPAVLSIRAAVLNANGKAYVLDRVYRLTP